MKKNISIEKDFALAVDNHKKKNFRLVKNFTKKF